MLLSAFKFKAFSIPLLRPPVPQVSMVLAGGKQKANRAWLPELLSRVCQVEEHRPEAPALWLGTVLLVISGAESIV